MGVAGSTGPIVRGRGRGRGGGAACWLEGSAVAPSGGEGMFLCLVFAHDEGVRERRVQCIDGWMDVKG
jgi:hypothetical protein